FSLTYWRWPPGARCSQPPSSRTRSIFTGLVVNVSILVSEPPKNSGSHWLDSHSLTRPSVHRCCLRGFGVASCCAFTCTTFAVLTLWLRQQKSYQILQTQFLTTPSVWPSRNLKTDSARHCERMSAVESEQPSSQSSLWENSARTSLTMPPTSISF